MAVPPSDKIPVAKMYRLQYIKQSNSSTMPTHLYDWAVSSNKKYLNYIYFQGQNNGSWYTPVEISATEDTLEFYVGRTGTAAASDFYIYVNGTQYTVGKWGYQVKCIFAAYSSIGSTANNLVASTILPLYDPAYTDTEVTPIVINKLTRSQYGSITPDDTQLYLVTDANLETTNHKVQSIDENSTDTQYPSATAVNNVKYQNEPFWIQPTEDAYVGMVGMTMGPSATRAISYSFDGIEWLDTTVKGLIQSYCYVLQGEKIYFKSSSTGRYWSTQFVVKDSNSSSGDNVDFTVGGRLISLFNGIPGDATGLLSDTNVTDASKLDINSETTCCTCASLFLNCVVLNTPPVLPATLLPDSAYNAMFYGCTSLINAPALPAETLTDFCYMSMFANCTSLRYAPPIKAKTLAEACCQEMFLGCTSLETAPELLATTMVLDCYYGMFSGCTSLKQIPKLYATTLAEECYQEMFNGCTSLELQTASDGTHYNIVKVPEKPRYDWTLTWNNSMVTAPNGSAIFNDTLVTGVESPVFPTPLYALPSATTFNGSSTYIDTGVQLLNTDQDFTIFVDFQYNSQTSMMTVFHCINEASPYPGILLDAYNSYFRAVYYGAKNIAAYDTSRHKIIFTHSAGTTTSCLIYFDSTTGVANTVDRAYSNVSQNVLLGCYQDTSGNKGRWFNGTIYDARIYNAVLSSTQIGYLMSSGDWSVRGATLTGLTFKRNNITYDSINVDLSGNMYYGQNGTYAEAYYASTGWVDASYKTLIVSNDPADFEDKFVNTGENAWGTFKDTNLTISYAWDARGLSLTGMNFKSNNTTYNSLAVNSSGDIIKYGVQNGYLYDRLGGWYINNMPLFYQVYKFILYTSSDGHGNIQMTWEGPPSTLQGNSSNQLVLNGEVLTSGYSGGIVNWQIWSYSDANSSGYTTKSTWYDETIIYNTNGWTNSNYKTLTSSYNLGQHFTGTNWSDFFATNKNTNTSTTITVPTNALTNMFYNTGGTWTGTPVINKAYFTNAVLIPEANEAQTNAGYPEIWWKDALVTSGINSLYTLPQATVFNGSSTYIDTGVQLLNGDPNFSLFVDFAQAVYVNQSNIVHCNTEVSPYPGMNIDTWDSKIRYIYYGGDTAPKFNVDTNRHRAVLTHASGARNSCNWYIDSTTATPVTGATTYSNVSRTVYLGCFRDSNGNRGRYFNGTIYQCMMFDRVLTSTEIAAFIAGTTPSTTDWSVENQTLSVRFMCNGILYNKLRIDSDGSMYYGRDNVYTIVYNVSTNTWTEAAKRIQVLDSISSTFINEWDVFLSQSKI